MQSETTKKMDDQQFIHQIPAGALPEDDAIELFGNRSTKKLFFMSNGLTDSFRLLSDTYKRKLWVMLRKDPVAWEDLKHLPYNEGLERFAYCVYGSLDHVADISSTGHLGRTDNFMCGLANCNCMNWHSKQITYKGKVVKGRMLDVLLAYRKGRDDKNAAADLGICIPTLNSHKKKLFEVFEVGNKTELVIAAITARIIQ